jgi:CDP-glucose 4,6-dehydratase
MGRRPCALEGLDVKDFGGAYAGRRVLVTGHTGFKGSWLTLWLHELGAELTGIALDPETKPNHWDLLKLPVRDVRLDIRNAERLAAAVAEARPEIVFHLAAQPLVRRSYRAPLDTWASNVIGTSNLLDACRRVSGLKAVVAVTTDKVYQNNERPLGYRESDALGGYDPYSASKAATELVIDSYRKSFFTDEESPLIASARAGNVIGGGDWSEDRLIPDIARATARGESVEIRSPQATRPWQHVLECLAGYLTLGQRLLNGEAAFAEAWNFGPEASDNRSVSEVLDAMRAHWPEFSWHMSAKSHPHEAKLLYLDVAKARSRLNWRPVWTLEEALKNAATWYKAHLSGHKLPSRDQLLAYVAAGHQRRVPWGAA